MIDKFVVDEQKEDKETIKELVTKINELVAAANSPSNVAPPRREIKPVEYAAHLMSFGQRVRSGPLQMLVQMDPCPLVTAIDEALATFQVAVVAYKQSKD